jgi:hypothetical protein
MDIQYKAFYGCRMNDSAEVKAVPENTIIAYVIPGVKKDVSKIIRPCKPSREWMDNTPGQYAYRCIPLDAFVRTDWVPFPFTMNWRITTPNETIRFAAGEPNCRVLPHPLELLNDMKIELHDMHEDPAFVQTVKGWEKQRQVDYQNQQKAEQEWAAQGKKPRMKDMWNSQYAKGRGSNDASVEHQTVFKCADVVDERD